MNLESRDADMPKPTEPNAFLSSGVGKGSHAERAVYGDWGKGFSLDYILIRSQKRKKTLTIQIGRTGDVLVRVPFRTPQREIDGFLAQKEGWLQKIIKKQQKHNEDRRQHACRPGETFLYLGNRYTLNIHDRTDLDSSLTFTGREFLLSRDAIRGGRILFHLWYQKQARIYFEERIRIFSRILKLAPAGIAVDGASSRWGSCSPDGRLAFSWRLIMAPTHVVDYVVVHELCHLKFRNHSPQYWQLVERILPDHKKDRAWLRDHGHLLTL